MALSEEQPGVGGGPRVPQVPGGACLMAWVLLEELDEVQKALEQHAGQGTGNGAAPEAAEQRPRLDSSTRPPTCPRGGAAVAWGARCSEVAGGTGEGAEGGRA